MNPKLDVTMNAYIVLEIYIKHVVNDFQLTSEHTVKILLECYEIIKNHNSKLVGYACIIDRSTSEVLIKDKIVSQIKLKIETYKANQLPNHLKKIKPIKPGSRKLSK